MSDWPTQYTLKTNDLLSQDCITLVCLTISGRLNAQMLQEKHQELVHLWPVLGGQLVMSTSPYTLTTGSEADFKHRYINADLKEVAPMDFSLSQKEIKGTKPIIRPYTTGKTNLSVVDLAFDCISTLNLKVGSLFAIRVSILNDATIIAFKFSHFFVDGEASYDIISQYKNLIAGFPVPKAVLPPSIRANMSSLIKGEDTIKVKPPSDGGCEYIRNVWQTGLTPWLSFVGRSMYQEYIGRVGLGEPGIEKHVYLPPQMVLELQKACQTEVNKMEFDGERPIVSKNDVITAWSLQRSYAYTSETIKLDVGYIYNYSPLLDQNPEEKYFTSQYVTITISLGTVEEMKKMTLAQVALCVRKSVVLARQPSVVRDNLEFIESVAGEKVLPMAKETDYEGMPLISSWTKFPFETIEFSSIVTDNSGTGKVLFNNARILLPLNIYLKPKMLYFNDVNGGIWIQFMQLPTHWKGFADINEYERD